MGWEHKDEYQQVLINTTLTSPNRDAMAQWPDNIASFRLTVLPLVPVNATYPTGTIPIIRGRQYQVWLQGLIDGYVFFEHYGYFGTTFIVIPPQVGEALWSIRKDLDDGFLSDPPMVRVIAPTDHTILLQSTRLGYKH